VTKATLTVAATETMMTLNLGPKKKMMPKALIWYDFFNQLFRHFCHLKVLIFKETKDSKL
jgi:hypothetical protein